MMKKAYPPRGGDHINQEDLECSYCGHPLTSKVAHCFNCKQEIDWDYPEDSQSRDWEEEYERKGI